MGSEYFPEQKNHYVLVHGMCHGAWIWYKLKARLESGGHKVTAIDLAASGTNLKQLQDVHTFSQYSEPLLEFLASLPQHEKVVLVGHSLGGLNIALAMEKFPQKVAVGVFLTAFLPDIEHKPSNVIEKIFQLQYKDVEPEEAFLDTKFLQCGNKTCVIFGPNYLSTKLYQHSTSQDLELTMTLSRPGSLFMEDLSQEKNFTKEGYGSVPRAFIVCKEDLGISLPFQRWMIQNAGINDVLYIEGADHMAMLSKPQQLCNSLLQIVAKYT